MRGEAIPGPHWLVIDLQRVCLPTRVVLDWEAAYSDHWIIQVGKERRGELGGVEWCGVEWSGVERRDEMRVK